MADPFAHLLPAAATTGANPFAALIPGKSEVTPDSVVRSLAQGASFGLADEFAAMMDAATHGVLGRGAGGDTYGQRYEANLAKERGQDKAFAEQHPYVDAGGKITGGVAGAVAALPRAAVAIGPNMLGNVFRTTATGAALGGLQGFGEGEGLQDRAERAAIGGTVGSVLGAATRPAAALGRAIGESTLGRAIGDNVISPPVNALAALLGKGAPTSSGGAQSGALDRLATMLQRGKLTPDDVSAKLARYGDQAMLADADPQLLSAAIGTKVLPGETRNIAEQQLIPRDRTAGQRLVGAFEGGEPPPSTFEAGQFLDANRRQVGAQGYGAMRDAGLNMSDEMLQMKNIPAVRDALAQIEQEAINTGTAISPVEVMHRVKQKLNDTAEAAFASGKPINKADVGKLAGEWERAFWQANPEAKAADVAYAQAASLPDTMQAGRNFLRKGTTQSATDASAPALEDLLARSGPQGALAARVGSTNAARETALEGTAPARALARRIDDSQPVREKLVQLYGPDRAEQIMRQAEAEGVFANTSNKLLRGSQTAEKASDAIDTMGNIGIRATPGNITPRATESVKAFVNWIRSPNQAVRDEIGRMTINPNAKDNARTLALLAELLKRRASGNVGSAGIASAAGGQAGGI